MLLTTARGERATLRCLPRPARARRELPADAAVCVPRARPHVVASGEWSGVAAVGADAVYVVLGEQQ